MRRLPWLVVVLLAIACLFLALRPGVHAGTGLMGCDDCNEDLGALLKGVSGYLTQMELGDREKADALLRDGIRGAELDCSWVDKRVLPNDPPDSRIVCRP